METLKIDGFGRAEARTLIMSLPRNKAFVTDILKEDGIKIYFTTDGEKESKENGKVLKGNYDIKVHYEGESKRKFSYINDIFIDIVCLTKDKKAITKKEIDMLLKAVKDSIELIPIKRIYKKYPGLKKIEKKKSGHSIEFILSILKILALQEDINYRGINPKTKEQYEGREKPYNALYDLLVKKMPLTHVTRKHMLY